MHAEWTQVSGTEWVFTIKADRFLRNMVRAVVGTLVEVGRGKMTVDEFRKVIEDKDRCSAGMLFLEQIQVLNLETREMVIERVLALDTAEFDLEDLKWVILMVLFNIPGCENAYQQMEELLFEVNEGMLH